jgi:osomolarity two-component system response regulator SSK1
MMIGSIPPINVLIVEDNIINLKLLEALLKRLKVRWQTAMNGREAVNKWRTGGFHLVLMDIQLPVMSGLEATREIRRLERVNSIGVFSSSACDSTPPLTVKEDGDDEAEPDSEAEPAQENGEVVTPKPKTKKREPDEADKLTNTDMFKSPVIIVALTASSLQSDRHEALAAGCNDFLTKVSSPPSSLLLHPIHETNRRNLSQPVNFVWLERKVMEWGCMQALIDFDGWRKWKDFSQKAQEAEAAAAAAEREQRGKKSAAGKIAKTKKSRLS